MENPLKDINEIVSLIRELEKIDSKLLNGQEILAYRDVGRLIAKLKKIKDDIVEKAGSK